MSNVKRKDSKNRNLRNGESQRKDGRYVYKYTDIYGKPQFIYSWKLVPTDKTPAGKRDDISLREKEAQIKKDLNDGIDTVGGKMTVCQLYEKKNNATAQRTFANSPHLFVDKWDTPILCIHGEKDFRILANQAMAAFDAAVMRGVPAELLIYPDENHWVLKPQNGVLWQRTFFEWLDKWLKPAK